MKNLIIIAVLLGGGFLVATKTGLFNSDPSPAAMAYKAFMDAYIARDYDKALTYTTGTAESDVKNARSRTSMSFMNRKIETPLAEKGIVEGSRVKVLEETDNGGTLYLTLIYSASMSWGGATANKMSPESWKRWSQTARMTQDAGLWKVASFTSEKYQP
jgi:hypothetical protein